MGKAVELLGEKVTERHLKTSLSLIREAAERMWGADSPRIIQDYTDHGGKHSERLAGYALKLLEAHRGIELSSTEAYLLLAGIFLHDIGMQVDVVKRPNLKAKAEELGAVFDIEFTAQTSNSYTIEEQKAIRKNHHYLSAAWIDRAVQTGKPHLNIPRNLVEDLMEICLYHTKLDINECGEDLRFENGRKRFVAALLRFADELDIESTRVEFEVVKYFSLAPENAVYWWLHNMTEIVIDKALVTMHVRLHPDDYDEYKTKIQELLVDSFRRKNRPILDVLAKYECVLRFDGHSGVTFYNYAEPLTEEIKNGLNQLGTRQVVETPQKPIQPVKPVETMLELEESSDRPAVTPLPHDAWLVRSGFRLDPFSYDRAEIVPADMLEETFVAYPGLEDIISWQRSTVLLAPRGSGKTASRMLLEKRLKERLKESLAGDIPKSEEPTALAVKYWYFDIASVSLDEVYPRWDIFGSTMLEAIAEAVLELIEENPEFFLSCSTPDRQYWWSFLEEWLTMNDWEIYLNNSPDLLADFKQNTRSINRSSEPFPPLMQFLNRIITRRLPALGMGGICFIMDGIDGEEDLKRAELLLEVLLDAIPLLQMKGLVFKFFLPKELEPIVKNSQGYKNGDLRPLSFDWDVQSLVELLRLRIDWASDYRSLENLAEQDLIIEMVTSGGQYMSLDEHFAALALKHISLGPPKALLRLGQELFKVWKKANEQIDQEQEAGEPQTQIRLSLNVWNEFLSLVETQLRPNKITVIDNNEIKNSNNIDQINIDNIVMRRVIIVLPGNLEEYEEGHIEKVMIAISDTMNYSRQLFQIIDIEDGSVRLVVEMPEGVAYKLLLFFILNNKIINILGIEKIEIFPKGENYSASFQTNLRNKLVKYFNLQEIYTICQDIDIDRQEIPAQGITPFARDLVEHCKKTGKIEHLIAVCRNYRPNIDWVN